MSMRLAGNWTEDWSCIWDWFHRDRTISFWSDVWTSTTKIKVMELIFKVMVHLSSSMSVRYRVTNVEVQGRLWGAFGSSSLLGNNRHVHLHECQQYALG